MANVISTVLKLDSKDFKSGLKSAQQSIAETNGVVNKAKVGAASFWSSLTGRQQITAAATAAVAVGALASKAISDASNLEESINAVNVAYGDAANGVRALGEDSAESFGLSERAFNEFAVQFSAFAEKVAAGTGTGPAAVLGDITQRIADFASVMNIDLAQAAQVFQSALAGETEPIRRFGGDMSAATVEAFALEHGLIKTHAELTEGIKVQARYGLLMEQTAKTAGDFKNTSDGLANSQRTLSANLEDASAKLGKGLTPALADVVGIVNDLLSLQDEANKRASSAPGGSGGIFSTILGAFSPGKAAAGALDEIHKLTSALDDLASSSADPAVESAIRGAVEGAAGIGEAAAAATPQVTALSDATKDGGDAWGGYVGAVGQATSAVGGAHGDFRQMQEDLEAVNEEARDNALGILADAATAVGDAVDDAFGSFDEDLGTLDLLDDIADQFDKVAEASKKATDPQTTRDYQREVRRLREEIGRYLQTLDGIPPDKVTNIIAQLRGADVDQLQTILDDLTKDRFINIGVNAPKLAGFDSANAVFTPGAAPSAPTFSGVSTPVPVPVGSVDQRTIINNYPVGTTVTTQWQNDQIDLRRNGPR